MIVRLVDPDTEEIVPLTFEMEGTSLDDIVWLTDLALAIYQMLRPNAYIEFVI